MCVGIPMQIVSIHGLTATAREGGALHEIDLSLTGPVPPGDWVLTHLGAARERLSATDAALITQALDGLRAIMAGGDAGDAFADIEIRGPQLPPHLAEALARGDTTG